MLLCCFPKESMRVLKKQYTGTVFMISNILLYIVRMLGLEIIKTAFDFDVCLRLPNNHMGYVCKPHEPISLKLWKVWPK